MNVIRPSGVQMNRRRHPLAVQRSGGAPSARNLPRSCTTPVRPDKPRFNATQNDVESIRASVILGVICIIWD